MSHHYCVDQCDSEGNRLNGIADVRTQNSEVAMKGQMAMSFTSTNGQTQHPIVHMELQITPLLILGGFFINHLKKHLTRIALHMPTITIMNYQLWHSSPRALNRANMKNLLI